MACLVTGVRLECAIGILSAFVYLKPLLKRPAESRKAVFGLTLCSADICSNSNKAECRLATKYTPGPHRVR